MLSLPTACANAYAPIDHVPWAIGHIHTQHHGQYYCPYDVVVPAIELLHLQLRIHRSLVPRYGAMSTTRWAYGRVYGSAAQVP